MEHLSNISRIHNCLNQFGTEYEVWDIFLLHFFSCGQQLKTANLPTRKIFGDPRNTHEKKLWTHEIPTKKFLDPWNTYEGSMSHSHKTHETPMSHDQPNLAHSVLATFIMLLSIMHLLMILALMKLLVP